MEAEELHLEGDPDAVAQLVRMLSASVNVGILALLVRARRDGQGLDGDGWLFLSEIAEEMGETPGTVGAAIQKLTPLLEEKREKGRRYFRTTVADLRIDLKLHPRKGLF